MKICRTFLVLATLLTTNALLAEDWPQWRGPNRDNKSEETGLLKSWPEGGPKLLWTYKKAGNAYSSFAVVGERAFTMGQSEKGENVIALNTSNGKELWVTDIGRQFSNRWGGGPRSTPTIDGGRLYALGGGGDLVCLNVENGKKIWSVNLKSDLKGRMMSGWGYSESVLIDGDNLLCTPGGSDGTIAALDKKTGKLAWRSKGVTDPAAYSSIIVANIGGIKQYVQQTGNALISVNAKNGDLLWRHPKRAYRTAVIPTPVVNKGHVYVTVGYGVGCYMVSVSPDGNGSLKVEESYANNDLESKHGGVLLFEGHLYGHHDRNGWTCQNFENGEKIWAERGKLDRRNRSGSLTYADGRLYLYSDQGTVALIEPSPKGWKEHGKFRIPQQSAIRSRSGGVWSHPVVANGRLYLRDQDLIFCYDVSDKK